VSASRISRACGTIVSITSLAAIAGLTGVVSCASASQVTSRNEAAANPRPMEGTVAVLTTAELKGCKDQRECAEGQAVRALLFVGVPDSPQPRPLVPNEQEAVKAHHAFFTDLLEKKGFTRYIVRVGEGTPTSSTRPDEKQWNVVVNNDALRRALETAGVIRRFGY
jgi:hypothetical protein